MKTFSLDFSGMRFFVVGCFYVDGYTHLHLYMGFNDIFDMFILRG